MGVYKMLVLNCQKMLEINCHFLLESTCRLQKDGDVLFDDCYSCNMWFVCMIETRFERWRSTYMLNCLITH